MGSEVEKQAMSMMRIGAMTLLHEAERRERRRLAGMQVVSVEVGSDGQFAQVNDEFDELSVLKGILDSLADLEKNSKRRRMSGAKEVDEHVVKLGDQVWYGTSGHGSVQPAMGEVGKGAEGVWKKEEKEVTLIHVSGTDDEGKSTSSKWRPLTTLKFSDPAATEESVRKAQSAKCAKFVLVSEYRDCLAAGCKWSALASHGSKCHL